MPPAKYFERGISWLFDACGRSFRLKTVLPFVQRESLRYFMAGINAAGIENRKRNAWMEQPYELVRLALLTESALWDGSGFFEGRAESLAVRIKSSHLFTQLLRPCTRFSGIQNWFL
jgi:hypothetical protein